MRPMTRERRWMVFTTGGAIRSRLFAWAVISTRLLFRHWQRAGVRAKLRPNRDRRETLALRTELSVPAQHHSWLRPDSTAKPGCKPQCTSDHEAAFARRTPA